MQHRTATAAPAPPATACCPRTLRTPGSAHCALPAHALPLRRRTHTACPAFAGICTRCCNTGTHRAATTRLRAPLSRLPGACLPHLRICLTFRCRHTLTRLLHTHTPAPDAHHARHRTCTRFWLDAAHALLHCTAPTARRTHATARAHCRYTPPSAACHMPGRYLRHHHRLSHTGSPLLFTSGSRLYTGAHWFLPLPPLPAFTHAPSRHTRRRTRARTTSPTPAAACTTYALPPLLLRAHAPLLPRCTHHTHHLPRARTCHVLPAAVYAGYALPHCTCASQTARLVCTAHLQPPLPHRTTPLTRCTACTTTAFRTPRGCCAARALPRRTTACRYALLHYTRATRTAFTHHTATCCIHATACAWIPRLHYLRLCAAWFTRCTHTTPPPTARSACLPRLHTPTPALLLRALPVLLPLRYTTATAHAYTGRWTWWGVLFCVLRCTVYTRTRCVFVTHTHHCHCTHTHTFCTLHHTPKLTHAATVALALLQRLTTPLTAVCSLSV